jgi:hypothetical protein
MSSKLLIAVNDQMDINTDGDFYCSRDLNYGPLGYYTMKSGRWIPTFLRNMLPLSLDQMMSKTPPGPHSKIKREKLPHDRTQ